jgi:hypothetical protein
MAFTFEGCLLPASESPSLSPTNPADSHPGPDATARNTVAPTSLGAWIPVDSLPNAELDPTRLLGLCDTPPSVSEESLLIDCEAGFRALVRAMRLIADEQPERALLHRVACATTCSDENFAAAIGVAWWKDGTSWSADISPMALFVTHPAHGASEPWPERPDVVTPPLGLADVGRAPSEIANRMSVPFCGVQTIGASPDPMMCFEGVVLAGQPAELLVIDEGIEGDRAISLYRSASLGGVRRYKLSDGEWSSSIGGLILGPAAGGWEFDGWSATHVVR